MYVKLFFRFYNNELKHPFLLPSCLNLYFYFLVKRLYLALFNYINYYVFNLKQKIEVYNEIDVILISNPIKQ